MLHGGGRVCELNDAYWMMFVDTAKTIKETSDYTVAQVWVVTGDRPDNRAAWLIDEWRDKQMTPNIVPVIKQLCARYPRISRVGIEGIEVAQYARKGGVPGVIQLSTKQESGCVRNR